MHRRADSLSTAVINDQRRITVTGHLVGLIPVGRHVRLDVMVRAEDQIEIHDRETP